MNFEVALKFAFGAEEHFYIEKSVKIGQMQPESCSCVIIARSKYVYQSGKIKWAHKLFTINFGILM